MLEACNDVEVGMNVDWHMPKYSQKTRAGGIPKSYEGEKEGRVTFMLTKITPGLYTPRLNKKPSKVSITSATKEDVFCGWVPTNAFSKSKDNHTGL